MAKQSSNSKPLGVLLVCAVLISGVIANLCLGLWLIATGSSNANFNSNLQWIPLVNGLLSLIMGLLFLTLLRLVLQQSTNAYPLIQTMAFIIVSFSLFRLPVGFVSLTLGIIALIASNSGPSKAWLRQEQN